jgi:hypothetical protein
MIRTPDLSRMSFLDPADFSLQSTHFPPLFAKFLQFTGPSLILNPYQPIIILSILFSPSRCSFTAFSYSLPD